MSRPPVPPRPAAPVAVPAAPEAAGKQSIFQSAWQEWPRISMAIALLLIAGMVDAVGFLHLSGLFVSFMSGNTSSLGLALVQGAEARVGTLLELIASFAAGAFLGTLIELRAGQFHRSVILVVEALLLLLVDFQNQEFVLLALAMGMQNASVRQVGSVAVTLTYATGYVVNVATRLAKGVMGQPRELARALFLLTLWSSILIGAALGAYLYGLYQLRALWLPTGLLLVGAALNLLPEFRNDLPRPPRRFRLLALPRPPRLMR
ncbi:YoaK family protein [Deinococcus altitudinis]|uniref:YoaK family protein n=1 Tax=Deinococcus altitudinis TaxID=468914 RepID=UPI003891860D